MPVGQAVKSIMPERDLPLGSQHYGGYLKPWLPDIYSMWDEGLTGSEIARRVAKKIASQSHRLRTAYGEPWPRHWRIPEPSAPMVLYALKRTRPDAIAARIASSPPAFRTEARWLDILPPALAREQARHDRLRTMHRMHDLGISNAEIGRRFNLSRERVHQLMWRRPHPRSPLQIFLLANTSDLETLRKSLRLRRWASKLRDTGFHLFTEAP